MGHVPDSMRAAIAAFQGNVQRCPDGVAYGALTQSVWKLEPRAFDKFTSDIRVLDLDAAPMKVDERFLVLGAMPGVSGRRPRGADVDAEILHLATIGTPYAEIAERYELSVRSIGNIVWNLRRDMAKDA